MPEDIDVDAGVILSGDADVETVGETIYRRILATASGEPTSSKAFGYGDDEFVPWHVGAVL